MGFNIVLDLDGSIIAIEDRVNFPIPRPYVSEFLQFCFDKFDNVGIWTAASDGWAYEVIERLFTPEQKKKLAFIWTEEKCDSDIRGYVLKPLKKIWNNPKLKKKGFNRHNTIILEDNHKNCKKNYGNNIIVKPYKVNLEMAGDPTLLKLMGFLETYVFDERSNKKRGGRKHSHRHINFLDWGLHR